MGRGTWDGGTFHTDSVSNLHNQSLFFPAHFHVPQSALGAFRLQGSQVFHCESVGQLVEDGAVYADTPSLFLSDCDLIAKLLSKDTHLLIEAILCHHHGEVQTSFRFVLCLREQMEDNATTEPDNGCSASICVLYSVVVFQGLQSCLFQPVVYGSAQSGHIDFAFGISQDADGFLYFRAFCFCALAKLRDLRETGIWHLSDEDARRESILYVVVFEEFSNCTVCSEHSPIVGHICHAAFGLVGVVVLSPFSVVEAEAIDVVL